jgi:hypothetical protein
MSYRGRYRKKKRKPTKGMGGSWKKPSRVNPKETQNKNEEQGKSTRR